jgi:hypothetical protein
MTAIPSRERQLIDGVWQWVTASESPGGGLPAGGSTGEVLTKESNADGDAGWEPGGGSPFVTVKLRHSAAFADVASNAPVATVEAINSNLAAAITLPPSAFGNDGSVKITVYSDLDVALEVGGSLVVQNADGTVFLEQDTNTTTHIGPTGTEDIDFDQSGGGAGAGLSWGAVEKRIDIASAGVYSAFVTLYVALA